MALTVIATSLISNHHERAKQRTITPKPVEVESTISASWVIDLRQRLKTEEGFRAHAYHDGHGFAIGYGHTHRVREGQRISEKKAEEYLDRDVQIAITDAQVFLPTFNAYPDTVKIAVADMAFVLGRHGLEEFDALHTALVAKDYVTAAGEVLNSLFAQQDTNRATSIANLIHDTGNHNE